MPSSPSKPRPYDQVHSALFRFMHRVKGRMQHEVKASELTLTPMQVRALKVISVFPDCTALEVADFLDRDKAQVTRLLKELMDQGLLTKVPNPKDRRSQILEVTGEGDVVRKTMEKIEDKVMGAVFNGLSEDELKAYTETTLRMLENLESME